MFRAKSSGSSHIDEETKPLTGQYRTYPMRWFVLFLTSAAFTWHSFLYVQLVAIARSLRVVFGWDRGFFSMLSNYWPIVTLLFAIPGGWGMKWLGMRRATILLYALCFLSGLVRCFRASILATTVLTHISAALYALPGVFYTALPLVVSAEWFAPRERMMSTNVGVLMNDFGGIIGYLVGPLVVQSPGVDATTEVIAREYYEYTWGSTAFSALFLMLTIFLLPSKPKSPPSPSAADTRLSVTAGYKKMLRSKSFWVLNVVFSFTTAGFIMMWVFLNPLLELLDITQVQAGIIGVVNSGVSMFLGFTFGTIAGRYQCGRAVVVTLHLLSIFGFLWLLLDYYSLIPNSPLGAGIAVLLGCACTASMIGITQEMTVDALYPIPELAVSMVTLFCACIVSLVVFGIGTAQSIPLTWFFWFLLISRIATLLLFISVPYETHRTDAEEEGNIAEPDLK